MKIEDRTDTRDVVGVTVDYATPGQVYKTKGTQNAYRLCVSVESRKFMLYPETGDIAAYSGDPTAYVVVPNAKLVIE